MNENENATAWSWQPPPLPRNLLIVGSDQTRHSDTWFRRFWGCETFLALGAIGGVPGQSDLILSCQLSVPGGDNYRRLDLHAVKCAVKALRFDHPTIASQCAWPDMNALAGQPLDFRDGRLAYQVPKGDVEVEAWLSQSVIDRNADLHTCSYDLDQTINLVRRDLGRAIPKPRVDTFQVHFIPSSGTEQKHGIVLLLGHLVFDSTAAFQVMNLLLSKIADIIDVKSDMGRGFAWGEEVKKLARPFPDRSIIPWSTGKKDEDLYMSKRFTDAQPLFKTAHGLNVPYPTASPSTTGFIFKTISSTCLSRLMGTIRKQLCTMFCVLLATSVISTLRINPPKANFEDITTPSTFIPINLRNNCLKENEDVKNKWEIISAIAITIFFVENLRRFVHDDSSLADKRRLVDDIFTLATEVKSQLEDQRPHMARASAWFDDDLIEIFFSNPPPPGNIVIPAVSSIGIMDTNLPPTYSIANRSDAEGVIRISDPLLSSRSPYPASTTSVALHAYTWQGVLRLSCSYPEAYMDSPQKLQARGNGFGESNGNFVDYVEEFMKILDIIMDANDDEID